MDQKEKKVTNLIRIMNTDINTNYNMAYGLARIKGVGYMFSNAICVTLKLDKNRKIGSLTETEQKKIESFLSDVTKFDLPVWLLNQRKEYQTGEDMHLVSKDIDFNLLQMRRREAKTKSYRSLRAKAKLPLRGQRTKSNFRKSKAIAAMKAKRGANK